MRFVIMSDLHLSKQPWQVRKALRMGAGADGVLLAGDLTNDGTPVQMALMRQCIADCLPDTPVFTVAGNHDYPHQPSPMIREGMYDYPALQDWLLKRQPYPYELDDSGAYAVRVGDVEIIGLNCIWHWRRFKFPENAQLEWLLFHLLESKAKRHIILCHAPLRLHQPDPPENGACYLSRDSVLQRIIDVERTEVIFLSGHTHDSMNCHAGCVEMAERNHLYINAGSIRPTTLKPDEPLQPGYWTDGNVVELLIGEDQTTVTGISMKTGQRIARGYYSFSKETSG